MKNIFLILCFFLSTIFSEVLYASDKPLSISVITGSYTIPARRYAKIVVNLEGSATFTIAGTTALRGTQNSVLGSDNIFINSTGSQWTTTTQGGGSVGNAYTEAIDQKTTVASFDVPAGTLLNGTGTWRAIVTLYER